MCDDFSNHNITHYFDYNDNNKLLFERKSDYFYFQCIFFWQKKNAGLN